MRECYVYLCHGNTWIVYRIELGLFSWIKQIDHIGSQQDMFWEIFPQECTF